MLRNIANTKNQKAIHRKRRITDIVGGREGRRGGRKRGEEKGEEGSRHEEGEVNGKEMMRERNEGGIERGEMRIAEKGSIGKEGKGKREEER